MATQLYRTLTGSSQKSGQTNSSLAPPTDLSKITTTNTQTGVLNHLTAQQEKLLDEFKERLQKDGWWSPDAVNGKPTHDDGTLLRYLRARKFDIGGAIGQFTDTEKWMKEQAVEELYEHFDVDFFERARLMYPQWTGHRDRRGIPIYVYEIQGLDSKNVSKYQKESAAYKAKLPNHKKLSTLPQLLPLFALYHNLLNFVLPFVSTLERPRPEIPVTNSTNIVDIQGVSLRQFWNLKNHMQDASVLATAHYPETLDRIFIIGAPGFFPTVWGWIKRWFDPVTVSKIFILSKAEVKPTLEKFMDPHCIPKKYGGTLDWAWGDAPDLDQETRSALERDGNKGWVKGPALWLNNERVVVGSENGKLRRSDKEIAEKKPIVYAADYTEEPVHPEKRRLSSVSRGSGSTKGLSAAKTLDVNTAAVPNGHLAKPPPSPLPEEDNKLEQLPDSTAVAGTGAAVSITSAASRPSEKHVNHTPPSHIPAENVRNSPMGDSQVHLPPNQAAPPSTTAEYISPTPSKEAIAPEPEHSPEEKSNSAITHESKSHAAGAAAAATAASTVDTPAASNPQVSIYAPPGHTQPGPLPAHQAELNRAIARKLEQESTVVIPATANGALPHPDVIVASDMSKGLGLEAEKLALRPQPERFVTAMEVPQN